MPARSPALLLACILFLSLLPACNVRHEYWINPDGSGKVAVEQTLPPGTTITDARNALVRAVLDAHGVDAWSDLSVAPGKNGPVARYTAYFKDLNALKLTVGGQVCPMPRFSTHPDGHGILTLPLNTNPPATQAAPASTRPDLDPTAVAAEMQKFRDARNAPALQMNLAQIHIDATFHLPATVARSSFPMTNGNTVRLDLDGAKLQKAYDQFLADDDKLRKFVTTADWPLTLESALRQANPATFVATSGPLEAILSYDAKPLFDYPAESARAKPASVQMLLDAGIILRDPPAAPKDGGFASLAVKSIRKPFGKDLYFELEGQLPYPVAHFEALHIFTMLDDQGNYLLPTRPAPLPASGRILPDGRTVMMSIISGPGLGTRKIARIVGLAVIGRASAQRDLDLGEIELKAGAAGKLLGLKIDAFASFPFGRPDRIMAMGNVSLEASASGVKLIRFLDADGKKLFSVNHIPGTPWTEPVNWATPDRPAMPEKAQAIATVFDDYQRLEIPLDLKDIALTITPSTRPAPPAATPPP